VQVHHLAVVVADLARAEAFYVGVLGLPVVKRWEERSIWVDLEGAFLAIELAASSGPKRIDTAPGFHCLALRIPQKDREIWRSRLAAAGHPVERESAFTLYVRDPDGNLVGLSHHPDALTT
jgi:catechol 2,3-dioxygenase-like lactoylglutathione lyase family enzyme